MLATWEPFNLKYYSAFCKKDLCHGVILEINRIPSFNRAGMLQGQGTVKVHSNWGCLQAL